jgi:acetyl-CoA acetyltransferase
VSVKEPAARELTAPLRLFVVARRDPELYGYLQARFADDVGISVVLDRRVEPRRRRALPAAAERRRADRADRRMRPEIDEQLRATSLAIVGTPSAAETPTEARRWIETMQRGVTAIGEALDDRDRLERDTRATQQENDRLRAQMDQAWKELAEIDSAIARAIAVVNELRSRLRREPVRDPDPTHDTIGTKSGSISRPPDHARRGVVSPASPRRHREMVVQSRGLRDKYCIVGVGETEYSRASGRTTRAMAVEAIRKAILDAGLTAADVDGMLDYQGGDSTLANSVASDLGIRFNFYMDVMGGGSSTEALVGLAMGAIEAGMCNTVAIYRSMNGYSEFRIGGTGARAAQPVRGLDLAQVPYGMRSAGQNFAPTFMRHMYEYGTTSAQVAHVRVAHSKHASQNPKALLKQRVTVQDVLASRWIVKPLHLLDCCLETDNATCIIVTAAERARNLKQRPVHIMGVAGRVSKPRLDFHWAHGPISRVAGYYAKDIIFPQAGIGPEDVHVTGSYDAFTFTTMLQLEEYGFCKKGEGGAYVSSGVIELGGKRPNNTSGSHLCEGYTHGMSMVIENVRQLRGTVDDYCPRAAEGVHTFDYSPGHCRQVKDAEITMNLGWAMPATGSALIMRRG